MSGKQSVNLSLVSLLYFQRLIQQGFHRLELHLVVNYQLLPRMLSKLLVIKIVQDRIWWLVLSIVCHANLVQRSFCWLWEFILLKMATNAYIAYWYRNILGLL
jgi:hypothetical protein